jgi:hypothetical protein
VLEGLVLLRPRLSQFGWRDHCRYRSQDYASATVAQSRSNLGQGTARITSTAPARATVRCPIEPSLRDIPYPKAVERSLLAHRDAIKLLLGTRRKVARPGKRGLPKANHIHRLVLPRFTRPSTHQEPGSHPPGSVNPQTSLCFEARFRGTR